MPLRKWLPVFFILLMNGPVFSQTFLTNSVEIQREDGSVIRYYLEWRNGDKPSAQLFLFLHGSDCNSVLHIPLLYKIKSIHPAADMLYIEKYGITDSLPYSQDQRETFPEGYIQFDHVKQRASDAHRVLTAVVNRFDYRKIIVFGASEGATVAYLLANQFSTIDALITMGGGGSYFIDDVIQSIHASDLTPEEKHKTTEEFRVLAQNIISHGHLDFAMSDHGFLWWKSILSLNQQQIIYDIDIPLLILQGEKDTSASPEQATDMVNELKQAGKSNIDYYFYPDYDHSLNFSKADGSSAKVITDMQVWLEDKLSDRP